MQEDARTIQTWLVLQEKVPSSAKSNGRKISMAEVEKHASKESAWFVRDGKVSFSCCCCLKAPIRPPK